MCRVSVFYHWLVKKFYLPKLAQMQYINLIISRACGIVVALGLGTLTISSRLRKKEF